MNPDLETIARHLDTKPATVQEAEEFAATADADLAQVAAKIAPDLTEVTATNLTKIRRAAVTYATTHQADLETARAIVTIAQERVEAAWRASVEGLVEAFAKDFDETAAALIDESTRLGDPDPDLVASQSHNQTFGKLHDLSQKLDALVTVRDAYANRSGPLNAVSSVYEPLSRIAELPDAPSATLITNRCGRTRRGVSFWLNLTRFPGINVKWQTRTQQQAQPAVAHLTRHTEALATRAAEVDRAAADR